MAERKTTRRYHVKEKGRDDVPLQQWLDRFPDHLRLVSVFWEAGLVAGSPGYYVAVFEETK